MSHSWITRSLLALIVSSLFPPALYGIISEELEAEIICPCDCGKVLYTCQCGTAHELRGTIKGMLEEGKNRKEILAWFEDTYGEVVLAAPKAEGFNLVAWILPFAAVGLAGSLLCLILWRWSSGSRQEPVVATAGASDVYQQRVEADLKKMKF